MSKSSQRHVTNNFATVHIENLGSPATLDFICHKCRTIACCQLLDATEVAMTQNSEKSENFHFVSSELGDGKRVYVKKQESKPIAFAMYKHNKNENDMRRRYGELFWIYATQRGQMKSRNMHQI